MMESLSQRGRDYKNDIEVPPVGLGRAPDRPEGGTLAFSESRGDRPVPPRTFRCSGTP